MVKINLLIRFCQIYSNKLPKRSLSSFKISEFKSLGSSICGFLYADFTVLHRNSTLCVCVWEGGGGGGGGALCLHLLFCKNVYMTSY